MVMYRGENVFQGSAAEAVIAYSDILRKAAREAGVETPSEDGLNARVMTFDAEIAKVTLLDENEQPVSVVRTGSKATACVDVHFHKDVEQPIFSFTVRTPDGRLVYDTTTRWQGLTTPSFAAGERARVRFELDMTLLEGEYDLGVDVASTTFSHYYDRMERALSFAVLSGDGAKGVADLKAQVHFELAEPHSLPEESKVAQL
jgi:hypothetical protein